MARIQSIPGIQSSEAEALQNKEIKTREAFWSKLGNNDPEKVDQLSKQVGISQGRLIGLYASDLLRQPGFNLSWIPRFLFLLVLLLALILFLNPAVFFQPGALSRMLPGRVTSQVVASPAKGLKAHEILEAKDLATTRLANDPLAFQDPQKVTGGYLLNDLTPGQVIHASDFVPAQEMAGRQIVSISVAPGSIGKQLKPGTHVTLRALPNPDKNSTDRLAVPGVILLALDPAANTISVALTPKDVEDLLPLLPKSLVYLVQDQPGK